MSDLRVPDGPVLAVFAHPDDAEISSGATLAKFAASGRAVHLLILTNGDRGAQDPATDRPALAATRAAETTAAAAFLGLARATVLDTHDGELENVPAVRARIAAEVRRVRPAVVVTPDPTAWFFEDRYFNHRDHRKAGETTLDAVFPAAGSALFFQEELAGLEPWDVPQVWLAWTGQPNHTEDVSGLIATKLAALALHESQVGGDGIRFFEEWLPVEAAEAGARIGVEHGESFRVLRLAETGELD
ncbi:MAG: PIG-L deacetylase family protein [Actinomycetota bacterium]